MKIAFVILNYQNFEDTANLIEDILKLKGAETKIFVLDNNSPDGSGRRILEKYSDKTEVILLDKNYGFSKANNIGYKRAKEWGPDGIAVLNNDILISDKNFLKNLAPVLNSAIVVPDVINAKGQHQNPMRLETMSRREASGQKCRSKLMWVLLSLPIIGDAVCKKELKHQARWEKKYYADKVRQNFKAGNFVPHGAFVVFGREWIENEEVAFPSTTFMYLEEDTLVRYATKKGYSIKYEPKLKVKHLEGRSVTKANRGNERKKMKFKFQQQARALRWYLKNVV